MGNLADACTVRDQPTEAAPVESSPSTTPRGPDAPKASTSDPIRLYNKVRGQFMKEKCDKQFSDIIDCITAELALPRREAKDIFKEYLKFIVLLVQDTKENMVPPLTVFRVWCIHFTFEESFAKFAATCKCEAAELEPISSRFGFTFDKYNDQLALNRFVTGYLKAKSTKHATFGFKGQSIWPPAENVVVDSLCTFMVSQSNAMSVLADIIAMKQRLNTEIKPKNHADLLRYTIEQINSFRIKLRIGSCDRARSVASTKESECHTRRHQTGFDSPAMTMMKASTIKIEFNDVTNIEKIVSDAGDALLMFVAHSLLVKLHVAKSLVLEYTRYLFLLKKATSETAKHIVPSPGVLRIWFLSLHERHLFKPIFKGVDYVPMSPAVFLDQMPEWDEEELLGNYSNTILKYEKQYKEAPSLEYWPRKLSRGSWESSTWIGLLKDDDQEEQGSLEDANTSIQS